MHDTLRFMERDPLFRGHHLNEISFGLIYAFSENFVLPLSHDEVVHGKRSLLGRMPGDEAAAVRQRAAAVRPDVGAPGQEAALCRRRVRAARRVARASVARLAPRARRSTAGVQQLVRDCNRLGRALRRAARARLRAVGLRVDLRTTTAATPSSRSCAGTPRTTATSCASCNFSGARIDGYRRRRAAAHGTTARCSTPTPRRTAAATVGNGGSVTAVEPPVARPPFSVTLHAAAAQRRSG